MTTRTRLQVLKCYIEPLLLYGCETCTLMTTELNRRMATEMWFLRRMLKVTWIDKMTNEEVLWRARTKQRIIQTIAKTEFPFLGMSWGRNRSSSSSQQVKSLGNDPEEDSGERTRTKSKIGLWFPVITMFSSVQGKEISWLLTLCTWHLEEDCKNACD